MVVKKIGITKPNEAFTVELDGLDKSQKEAVSSEEPNILLRAPAGSGKTKSLLTAVAAYRYEYLNDKICAITFTRAARAEMEQRLAEMGIYDVEVTTIHVWSRNLLEDLARKYDFKLSVLQEARIKFILTDIINEYCLHSKVKTINVGIAYSFITGNKNMDVSDNYKRTLAAIERRYIAYKRKNMLYDFTDYPQYLYDMLKIYNETITIDALFVDEFQDVDPVQYELFNNVIAKKKFYVGDQWQSIYVFRGADGDVFDKAKDFAQYKLKYNYRSYQEIIDYATTVYCSLIDRAENEEDCYVTEVMNSYESSIVCHRGYGGKVYVGNPFGRCVEFSNGECRKLDISEAFKEIISKDPMILCRTNKQVKAINEMNYFECSTVHQAKGLQYPNVIVIDTTITCVEDLNVAYVAITRAQDSVMVINWQQFDILFNKYKR